MIDAICLIRHVLVEHSLVAFCTALFLVLSPPATLALGQADCWHIAGSHPTETLGVKMIAHELVKHLPLLTEMLEFSCVFLDVASVVLVYVFDKSSSHVVVYDFF